MVGADARFSFQLTASAIDVAAVSNALHSPADGAVAVFVGVVRGNARGRQVTRLEYEAYGSMAETEMGTIFEAMAEKFGDVKARVVHRTGVCQVGEPSVVVAVAAPHRAAAFDACRLCIDTMKQTVPIWKREVYADGSQWVGDRS